MLSKIAVATDGSETAQKAVDAALDMAQHYDAAVLILTAFESRPSDGVVWASSSAAQAERVLADAEDAAIGRGLACATAMGEGNPGHVIVDLAERHGADLVVVGSIGMQRKVLGSVPNTVTHRATCHVMVVKTD